MEFLVPLVLLGLNSVRYTWATAQVVVMRKEPKQYCSFFDNRAPKVQPGLKNCTWFKENSCCGQEEIDATFGRVKPLRGASQACQRYTNYLMCYICAPNQNIFYFRERLTVCEEFCHAWYHACKTAILKGSMMGDLFSNGIEFCKSCRFQVSQREKNNCFFFDARLDPTSISYVMKPKEELGGWMECELSKYLSREYDGRCIKRHPSDFCTAALHNQPSSSPWSRLLASC